MCYYEYWCFRKQGMTDEKIKTFLYGRAWAPEFKTEYEKHNASALTPQGEESRLTHS